MHNHELVDLISILEQHCLSVSMDEIGEKMILTDSYGTEIAYGINDIEDLYSLTLGYTHGYDRGVEDSNPEAEVDAGIGDSKEEIEYNTGTDVPVTPGVTRYFSNMRGFADGTILIMVYPDDSAAALSYKGEIRVLSYWNLARALDHVDSYNWIEVFPNLNHEFYTNVQKFGGDTLLLVMGDGAVYGLARNGGEIYTGAGCTVENINHGLETGVYLKVTL